MLALLIMHVHNVLGSLAFCLVLSVSSAAQVLNQNPEEDLGSLKLSHAHVRWQTPESLVNGLRADDDQARLQALVQIGAFKEQTTKIVDKPSEVELRYASLGAGEEQQAIVAIYLGPMLFGAVAARQNGVWIRIASFSCWCKYEAGDLIGKFVEIEAGPDGGSELVLHASGGGTGVYSQNEARFRYHRGELHLVFSFVSRFQECNPTVQGPYECYVERRWFYSYDWDSIPGGVLVESRLSSPSDDEPEAQVDVRDLELSCQGVFMQDLQMGQKEIPLHKFQCSRPVQTSTA
jgi:hypothetical protein